MNERQAFQAIRNAIRLENLSKRIAAKVTPLLLEAFKEVQQGVSRINSGDLLREQRLRQLIAQLAPVFRGPNDRLYLELTSALREEVMEQAYFAEKFLNIAARNPALPTVGLALAPAIGQGPVAQVLGGSVTRTQLIAVADDAEVLGKTLGELFGVTGDESHFINTQLKRIDKTVKTGFLTGQTNDEIARSLVSASNAAIRDSRAIARTAVMDMSQRAHERFWDANSEQIVLWEYDATMDYRVCPLCYPNDGKRRKNRKDLPKVPVHPNCRCRVLPLTKTALELEKDEMKEGMETTIVEVNRKRRDARGRIYKTKTKVDGTKMIKSAREIKTERGKRPTMADFIAQTTPDTRDAVLGKVRAREFEYLTTDASGPQVDIQKALMTVTNGDVESFAKAQKSRRRRRTR